MRRSLTYFWRIHLAVVLGAAVATAVLTGALLVGDSVRGSLRDLTLDRLGEIDYALVTHKYFREDLLVDLATSQEFKQRFDTIASAILANGTAVHATSKTRASSIDIVAVDQQFFSFYTTERSSRFLEKDSGQVFPSIIINESLQNQLQAKIGDQILLSFERPSKIARGSLLGRKSTADVVETTRFVLTKIIPDQGVGRFGVQANQNLPMNSYVSLPVLQRVLDQQNKVNALLISSKNGYESENSSGFLQQLLATSLDFEDLGLKFVDIASGFALESDEAMLSPQIVASCKAIADELSLPTMPVYTYLANTIAAKGRVLPYSTVTALPLPIDASQGKLSLTNGRPAPSLARNEILLNEWAARDLRVAENDSVTMTYFGVGPRDELFTKQQLFAVKGVVAMQDIAIDRTLTPDFPGIANADNMADWDPPFPVDLSLIRPKDEAYWDRYRGTPKAFVSEETGRELWSSRFGHVTSLRFAVDPDTEVGDVEEQFQQEFLSDLDPAAFHFIVQPVKAQGLASSSGATDFSMLFISFSFFLIVSAALLVGLLFRLSVENRAREVGMLLALGFPPKKVRRQFLQEGGLLASFGSILGLGGAVLYAWLVMVALRTWWLAAVGTPFLFLHINSLSLILGLVISMGIIFLSIWLGLRKLGKIPPPALLAGVTALPKDGRPDKKTMILAISTALLAVAMTVFAVSSGGAAQSSELFFSIGSLLLISGLAFFSLWLKGKHRAISGRAGSATVGRMAARNSPRNPGRSMLSVALVACASFVIIAVES
ncbi:MAG: ABC transporter permease, partial [bacterium]